MRSRLARRTTGRRSGFSLTELLIVVAILGMIAGVVIMGGGTMIPGAQLSQVVHTLAAEMYGARSEAISRGHTHHIVYDLDAGAYHILTPFRSGGGLARTEEERVPGQRRELPRGIEFTRVLVDGVEYTEGKVMVRFDPLGTVSGHSVLLTQGQFEAQYTLEVLPLTGMIRFHDGEFMREPPSEGDFE